VSLRVVRPLMPRAIIEAQLSERQKRIGAQAVREGSVTMAGASNSLGCRQVSQVRPQGGAIESSDGHPAAGEDHPLSPLRSARAKHPKIIRWNPAILRCMADEGKQPTFKNLPNQSGITTLRVSPCDVRSFAPKQGRGETESAKVRLPRCGRGAAQVRRRS